jgi:UDP-N-acetylglucosamine 2-epimerase (non-hydrolysing)
LFVLGTRPEIIKLAPVIGRIRTRARIVHTGQHYDPELSGRIWDALNLTRPDTVIGVGGGGRGAQIAAALDRLDAIVAADRPNVVVVQGDTNATLAGALVANAHGVPLVHVEAGLRSRDRAMPEEHNRVVVDHLADVLCAPTWANVDNLVAEGIPVDRVHLTGNTIVDAVQSQLPAPDAAAAVLRDHGVTDGGYVVATVHRPENTDDPGVLATILRELAAITVPVLLPLHPRTRERITASGLDHLLDPVRALDPLVPAQFLALCAGAAALVSDSGGLQEECSVLKRPLLVVRRSTERPEVLGTFAERFLPGPDISRVVNHWCADVDATRRRLATLPSPYGTEHSSDDIARLIAATADTGEGHRPAASRPI